MLHTVHSPRVWGEGGFVKDEGKKIFIGGGELYIFWRESRKKSDILKKEILGGGESYFLGEKFPPNGLYATLLVVTSALRVMVRLGLMLISFVMCRKDILGLGLGLS